MNDTNLLTMTFIEHRYGSRTLKATSAKQAASWLCGCAAAALVDESNDLRSLVDESNDRPLTLLNLGGAMDRIADGIDLLDRVMDRIDV